MKRFEIERKYLLRPCSPKHFLQAIGLIYRRYRIVQYYLPPQEGEYVRYRRRDQTFFKTIKRGEGMVREEYESSVTREEFDSHLGNHTGKVIEKERFVFVYQGLTYEMDHFQKALKGLCYLEIEFDDEEIARAFVLPEIFSTLYVSEVTEDKRFDNSSISRSTSIPALDTDFEVLVKKVTHSLVSQEHLIERGEAIVLTPYESSIVAIQTIFAALTMGLDKERNALLKNPDDAEVLHQFRISIRKIKSALDAFKAFLLPTWYSLHRRNLTLLMAQTNTNRDRDVLLEQMPFYRSLLPKKMQKGLVPLEELLVTKKEISDRHMLALAENELLRYEINSLLQPRMKSYSPGEIINQPIVITAMQIVEKQTNTIVKKGKKLDVHSVEEDYHRLRIKYKKLRYFIEVTQSLIERQKYKEIIKLIKKMQTILGSFHDYQVQDTLLLSFENNPILQKKKTKKAMAQLIIEIENLKEEQEDLFRKKFAKMIMYEKRIKQLFEVY